MLKQFGVAFGGELGEVPLGLGLEERGAALAELLLGLSAGGTGLGDLLIEFGGFDFGQELAFFDVIADIDVAFFYEAGGAGVDGGFDERRNGAG